MPKKCKKLQIAVTRPSKTENVPPEYACLRFDIEKLGTSHSFIHIEDPQAFKKVFERGLLHRSVHPAQFVDPRFEATFRNLAVIGLQRPLLAFPLNPLDAQIHA